ncbi:MAG: class I SAM-dependent methyltransferase [Thermoguttaceae bacterium]
MGLLSTLNLEHRSDKGACDHAYGGMTYLDIYEQYFAPIRHAVKSVLELGVYEGASLRLWRDYFTNAKIHGIDHSPDCKKHEGARVKVTIGPQDDPKTIDAAVAADGPFDLIIDDASHLHPMTIASWNLLWPHITPGGWYVIEDLGFCNAWSNNPRHVWEEWIAKIMADMDRPTGDIRRLDRWFYMALFQKL